MLVVLSLFKIGRKIQIFVLTLCFFCANIAICLFEKGYENNMKKIVILLTLLAVTVFLTAALVSCSCGDETPAVTSTGVVSSSVEGSGSTPETSGKTPAVTNNNSTVTTTAVSTEGTTPDSTSTVPGTTPTSTPSATSGTTPDSSSDAPASDTTPITSTTAPKLPAEPIAPSTEKADASGKLSLVGDAVHLGLLLNINENNVYDASIVAPFDGDENMTADEAIRRGYTHISSMFRTVDNKHFLRNEAIAALAALIQTFDAAAGTDKPFIVEGYTKDSADVTSAFITGNVLKLRIFDNDVTYGLNYNGFKVSLNGEMVTYDKWFAETAAKYGFIYEGLVGDENNAAGQLRYVGTIHSSGIKEAGSLEAYIDAIKAGTVTSATVGEDTWKLSYVKFSQSDSIGHYTVVLLGENATYTISGDNKEGLIVAVKVEAAE